MKYLVTLLVFIFSQAVQADVLVLVHGYLGSADSWERSGINTILDEHGWKRTGLFVAGGAQPKLLTTDNLEADNNVYAVNLPSEAPVVVQADMLLGMLAQIRQLHGSEAITIVGHSAGGVVARLALVRGGAQNVTRLITIASPHTGTSRAEQALDVTANHGPFNMVKSFFGGRDYEALRHSRGLLFDLSRPRPGSLLYWLNVQPHPDISYVSVIRTDPVGFAGDDIVPGSSQDMNNVPALFGKSAVMTTPAGHTLVAQDGVTILDLLKR